MNFLKLNINNPLLPVTLSAFVFLVSCRDKAVLTPPINRLLSDTTNAEWVDKKREFNRFLDSLQYGEDTIEAVVLTKLDIIRKHFAGDTHPDLPRLLSTAEGSGFNRVSYDTAEEHERCARNNLLPLPVRRNCFWRMLYDVVHQQQYKSAIRIYEELRPVFDSVTPHNWYDTGIDSLKRYLVVRDSIGKLILPADSLHYIQAHALRTVVMTAFYCHEGCGGCDHTLITDQLNSLIKLYPESDLVDIAAYELIEYQFHYDDGREEEVRTEEKKALTRFVKKYAGTDAAGLAENRLKEIEEILAFYQQE